MAIIGYLAALVMGLSMGLVGAGGSILTVPILVYFFHQDGLVATTGSLFVVGAMALIGAAMRHRLKQVDYKTGIQFAVPSMVGVFVARNILLPSLPATMSFPFGIHLTKSLLVLVAFSVLMIFASVAMIRSGSRSEAKSQKSAGTLGVITKGFLVGCTTGFVGAGGGFIIIPALVTLLNVPMRMAIGTSLAIIAVNSLFGFAVSFNQINIDWGLLLLIFLLGTVGLVIGHNISHRFNDQKLKKGFGYLVLLVGLYTFLVSFVGSAIIRS